MTTTTAAPTKAPALPDYLTRAELDMVRRFPKDTAEHRMTVLLDSGPYRHLRFSKPGTSFYWFDLITWPGTLVVNGDCGGFTFSRDADMFAFFRSNRAYGINPSYWSEKLPTNARDGARKYSEEVFRGQLEEELGEYAKVYPDLVERYEADLAVYETTPEKERYPWALRGPREPRKPMAPAEASELLEDYDDNGQLSHREGAMELLSELQTGGVVSDIGEWRMDDYAWEYLWACHAIVTGIRMYDRAKKTGHLILTVPAPLVVAPAAVAAVCSCGNFRSRPGTPVQTRAAGEDHVAATVGA